MMPNFEPELGVYLPIEVDAIRIALE